MDKNKRRVENMILQATMLEIQKNPYSNKAFYTVK